MPIAFTRMKQFESQGKQLRGIADGAAAGTVMNTGVRYLMRTTGSVMKPPPEDQTIIIPIHVVKREPPEDDDDFPKFDIQTQ